MTILVLIIFIVNSLFFGFSIHILVKQKKKIFIIHSLIFLSLALLAIYYYFRQYFFEAIFTVIIFGIPEILGDNTLPSLIKNKYHRLSYLLVFSIIVCGLVFYVF